MINLEKEIREQPDVLANISKVNKSTVEALVAKAKAAGVNNICLQQEAPVIMRQYTRSTSSEYSRPFPADSQLPP